MRFASKYTGACTKVARRSPKPLVVGSIPYRPCQTREKKPMIAADLFANRCGVQKQKENPEAPVNPGDSVAAHNRFPAAYGPLARRSSGWLITGWPRFDSWMGHQMPDSVRMN